MMRAWGLFLAGCSISSILIIGCSDETVSKFCDKNHPCPAGEVCDYYTRTCMSAAADTGALDGQPDTKREDSAADGQPDTNREAGSDGARDGSADARPDLQPPDMLKPKGAVCAGGGECLSGFCADKFCCDARCDGTCRACNLPGKAGTCSLIVKGSDPDKECTGTPAACGGTCDGAGVCDFAPSTTPCGIPASCTAGTLTTYNCDAKGGCASKQQSCGGYACASTGDKCRTTCKTTADCTGTAQCVGLQCVSSLPLGKACGTNNKACASGFCVDGVCCTTNACAACNKCDIAGKEGTCNPVKDSTSCGAATCVDSPTTKSTKTVKACKGGKCTSTAISCQNYKCNATKDGCLATCSGDKDCVSDAYCLGTACTAKKVNGTKCTATKECKSGHCAQGYCCDKACTGGPCEACDLSGSLGKCTYKKKGTKCGAASSCADYGAKSELTTHACTGSGAACKSTIVSCGYYKCASMSACKSSCFSYGNCISSAYCTVGKVCVPRKTKGTKCTLDPECLSGHCAQGYCCDKVCPGACEACNLATKEGTCSLKPAGSTCGATDKCLSIPAHDYVLHHECDGKDYSCKSSQIVCSPYKCDSGKTKCATSCAKHSECFAGFCDLFDTFGKKGTCPGTGNICYADAKTCPSNGLGTKLTPYCKIQFCLGSSSYVVVADGKYHENLVVSKDVQIIATGTTGPLVKNGLPQTGVIKAFLDPQGVGSPGVNITGSTSVVIYGLDISHLKGSSAYGPLVMVATKGGTVLLETCYIHDGNGSQAIYLLNGYTQDQNVTLDDVAVVGSPYGVESVDTKLTIRDSGVGGSGTCAINHSGKDLTLRDVLVAFNFGTGIQTYSSTLDLDRLKVGANVGDGLRLENSTSGLVLNTLVNDNLKNGIVLDSNSSPPKFVNVTVAKNIQKDLTCPASPSTTFYNAIVGAAGVSTAFSGGCDFFSSNVKGVTVPNSHGNIDQDPKFDTGVTKDPFTLMNISPCIDAGRDKVFGVTMPAKDILGKNRIIDKKASTTDDIDMGAYELQ